MSNQLKWESKEDITILKGRMVDAGFDHVYILDLITRKIMVRPVQGTNAIRSYSFTREDARPLNHELMRHIDDWVDEVVLESSQGISFA